MFIPENFYLVFRPVDQWEAKGWKAKLWMDREVCCIWNRKELVQLSHKGQIIHLKWVKGLNRFLPKGDVRWACKHVINCSMSRVVKGIQIKSTMRFSFTFIMVAAVSAFLAVTNS